MIGKRQDVSVGGTLYDTLRQDIIFGRLAAGSKLPLGEMKDSYGVSISTLRECLNRLAADGFVMAEEQRGFFVAAVTQEGLRDIASLRVLIEGYALERSIQCGDTEWEAGIVAAHHKLHRMEQRMIEGDHSVREKWKRYDWEFHQALIGACGSGELLRLHQTVFDKYLRYQMRVLTFRGGIAATEHKELLDAALKRDAASAGEVLRKHIEGGVTHSLAGWVGESQ
ncbi:MAG: GntR family transcriptional regulator [Paracoccaceae bacterium]